MSRKYTNLDMIRIAEFAKQNPELNRITLMQAYNKEFPKVTKQSIIKNIKAFIDAVVPCCPKCLSRNVTPWGVNNEWICGDCEKDFKY